MIWHLVFWLSVFLVFHSYVIYPWSLGFLSRGKKLKPMQPPTEWPEVYVLMSVYNAARILPQKLESLLQSDYPAHKLHIWIGSDASDDESDEILKQYADKNKQIRIFIRNGRSGKIQVINYLYQVLQEEGRISGNEILLLTDSGAMLQPNCLRQLVQSLEEDNVHLAGAGISNRQVSKEGISVQEKAFFEREIRMKYQEGLIWGASIGAFGACYAIRAKAFVPIPANFLVDDFFITMKVLENRHQAIYNLEAQCYLDVTNSSQTEFRRKQRISAGNFQNLALFWPLLFRFNGLAYAFFSHKVIRWLVPFLMLSCLLSSVLLYDSHPVYRLALAAQLFCFLSPLLNQLLERIQVHLKILKFVAHFYYMNLAVLSGFIQYCKGIKTNVWNPTQR